jgi:hypothetical protein
MIIFRALLLLLAIGAQNSKAMEIVDGEKYTVVSDVAEDFDFYNDALAHAIAEWQRCNCDVVIKPPSKILKKESAEPPVDQKAVDAVLYYGYAADDSGAIIDPKILKRSWYGETLLDPTTVYFRWGGGDIDAIQTYCCSGGNIPRSLVARTKSFSVDLSPYKNDVQTKPYYEIAANIQTKEGGVKTTNAWARFNVNKGDTVEPIEPLEITGFELTADQTTATVRWKTNRPANSAIDYGVTETRGTLLINKTLALDHEFTLTDLKPGTTYYFRYSSKDENGELVFDLDNSTLQTSGPDLPVEIQLNWTIPDRRENGEKLEVSEISKYIVHYGIDESYDHTEYAPGSATEAVIEVDQPGTWYFKMHTVDTTCEAGGECGGPLVSDASEVVFIEVGETVGI